MAAMTFHLDVVSAEKELYSGRVETCQVEGEQGAMGIMPGHAPLLTRLVPGTMRVVKQHGHEEIFYISGGILEIQPGTVTVLADVALRGDEIDTQEAEQARKRAEEQYTHLSADVDYAKVAVELAKAIAQTKAARYSSTIKKMS